MSLSYKNGMEKTEKKLELVILTNRLGLTYNTY